MGSRPNRLILAMTVLTVVVGILTIPTASASPKHRNQSPVLVFSPSQHQSVSVGTVATIDASGTYDPEGDRISFSWSSADNPRVPFTQVSPSVIRFTVQEARKYTFKVTARDHRGASMVRYASVWGTATAATTTTTTTTTAPPPAPNSSPVLVFSPDQHQTVGVGTVATIDASRTYDPDGDPISIAWSQAAGPTTAFTRVSDSVIRFEVKEAEKYVFKVTATDPSGADMVRYASVTGSASSTTFSVDLKATPGDASVQLNWTVTAGAAPTGWHIERDGADSSGYGPWGTDLPADARSFTMTKLLDQPYTFTLTPTGHDPVQVKASPSPSSTTSNSSTTTSTASTSWWSSDLEGSDPLAKWGIVGEGHKANRSFVSNLPGSDGQAMRVFSSKNNDGFTGFGGLIRSSFDKMGIGGQQEAVLRYHVYLPSAWHPYEGGKLPGLSGISPGMSTWETPGGGMYREDGWSGRVMWKKPIDGNLDHTRLMSYLYVRSAAGKDISSNTNPSNGRTYGISVMFRQNPDHTKPWDTSKPFLHLERGQWNTIELRYKMNTAGKNDGIFQGWLNGELGIDLRDVQYRTAAHPNLDINQMMFDTFYGGPTANTTDQHWAFDNVAIKPTR
jgi:hypothetical protein